MRLSILTTLCAGLLFIFAGSATSAPKDRLYLTPPSLASLSVVYVKMVVGACSGFVVSSGVVATAAHCVDEGELVSVKFADGREEPFIALYSGVPGGREDVAILLGNTGDAPALPLSTEENFPRACFVYAFGGGYKGHPTLEPCFILADAEEEGLVLMAEVDFGDSGGLILGRDGVLGIVWGLNREAPQRAYGAPVTELKKRLEQYNLIK